MISDSFFQQGVTHEVCQDYAIHGPDYAIVADGCSNGNGPRIDTDWGARFICKTAELNKDLIGMINPKMFFEFIARQSQSQMRLFPNLSPESLTATCLMVKHCGDMVAFMICGDGFFGYQRKESQDWYIQQVEFLPGGKTGQPAPFYPNYLIDHDDEVKRSELFGNSIRITEYQGKLGSLESSATDYKFECSEDLLLRLFHLASPDVRLAFVATDGVGSFYEQVVTDTKKHHDPVLPDKILSVLLDIPNYRPGFFRIQRSWAFKRNIQGTFLRRNWHAADDVAMGGIYCAE